MPDHEIPEELIQHVMALASLGWLDARLAILAVREWDFEQYRIGLEREHDKALVA